MAGEWREGTLNQLGRIVTGKTPLSSRPDYFGGDIPFVTPTDFDGRRLIETTGRHLTGLGADSVGARIPARSVMVSCIGSDMGKAAIAGRDCVTNQQINSIVVTGPDDPLFVYYNLRTRKAEIRSTAGGSAQPILNKSAFGQLKILLPPPDEQRAIAHVLGALDDKIELNRRMNETLEAIAQAIFTSWFVDFDPVRAKSEGRDTGVPDHLAVLFSDSFESSELGQVPRGWPVRLLSEVLRESKERVGEANVPEYSSTNEGLQLRSERFKKALAATSANNKLIRRGFLVFGLSRRVLNFGLMREEAGSVSAAYRVFAIDASAIVPDLLEGLMRAHPDYYYNALSASSREGQSVSAESVGVLRFVQPPMRLQEKYYEITSPFRDRTKALIAETRALADLRDVLLPKFISGEIRIKDVEKLVEANV